MRLIKGMAVVQTTVDGQPLLRAESFIREHIEEMTDEIAMFFNHWYSQKNENVEFYATASFSQEAGK